MDFVMIVHPNAKINLGLFIVGRREDGYHLLETGFLPVPLCDTLEINYAEGREDVLEVSGGVETGTIHNNLVLRAVRALREEHTFPALHLRLKKVIPSGAGLGGGSADASFTLRAICELCDLGISLEELERIALRLGADCPIFIQNKPQVGRGVGERLSPMDVSHLRGLYLTIIKPDLHIATAEAFQGLRSVGPKPYTIEEILTSPVAGWQDRLINDFEYSLFPKYRELKEIKDLLYAEGATFASLSGSGSSLYALSYKPLPLTKLEAPRRFIWQEKLPLT